jgi:serine protease Do
VIAVERDSSAAHAGIQVGDVIEEVSRQAIRSLEDFDKAMAAAKDSDRILLLIRRGDFSSYRVLRKRD